MKNTLSKLLLLLLISTQITLIGQNKQEQVYTYKEGDLNGIGKWYMGREIAYVMGFQGMDWLERVEREKEENTSQLFKNMDIAEDDHIADIGAGSGYHVFPMATMATKGRIYGVDIQDEMLMAMEYRRIEKELNNIELIKGTIQSAALPENSIDKVLMVDVYHEFSHPKEMMTSIYEALKKDGKLFLIEYRAEDPDVPIKRIHKMSKKQAIKEMAAAGFELNQSIDNLSWQHCLVFVKKER